MRLHFATKITLAQRMLVRAFAARVPARWVTADAGYGRSHAFRHWLEQRDQAYAVMIPKTTALQYEGRRARAEQLGARLSEEVWSTVLTSALGQAVSAHRSRLSSTLRGMSTWQAPLVVDPASPRGSWRP